MGGDNADDSGDGSDHSNPMLREQDRFLPIANVARIMKKTIPRTGKVNKTKTVLEISCKNHFAFLLLIRYNYGNLNLVPHRLPKMPGNVFKNVFLNSSVSSPVKQVSVATRRRGRPSMERIFFLQCLPWALITMQSHLRITSKSIVNQLKGKGLLELMDLMKELKNMVVVASLFLFDNVNVNFVYF